MAEFQKKKAREDLLSALRNMGLEVSSDLGPVGNRYGPMGAGETAPSDLAELPQLGPSYLPPAPAEPVATEPLEPPDGEPLEPPDGDSLDRSTDRGRARRRG